MNPEQVGSMSEKDREMMGVKQEKPKSPDFSHSEAVWIEGALEDYLNDRSADSEGLDGEQRIALESLIAKVKTAVERSIENDEQMQDALDLTGNQLIWAEAALKHFSEKRNNDPQGLDEEQKQTLKDLIKDISALVERNIDKDNK